MINYLFFAAVLVLGGWDTGFADTLDWRMNPQPKTLTASERQQIGHLVCGKDGYETSDAGVNCKACPSFTGNEGSDDRLEIESMIRGRFTSAESTGEWLLDTQGCEAHYDAFGGALLLAPPVRRSFAGSPALALGRTLAAKPPSGPLERIFYKPGFRLNDCLSFGGENARTLLVCNEHDLAHGEVVGHVSVMEVSRRGITRWRLVRWYDNSGTDMPHVVSVTPRGMRRVEPEPGQAALQIKFEIVETDRETYEKAPEARGRVVNLLFRRQGQRLFATEKTRTRLQEIADLTRKMLH